MRIRLVEPSARCRDFAIEERHHHRMPCRERNARGETIQELRARFFGLCRHRSRAERVGRWWRGRRSGNGRRGLEAASGTIALRLLWGRRHGKRAVRALRAAVGGARDRDGVVTVVLLRQHTLSSGDRHLDAVGEERRVERLAQRDRVARDQRQLDVRPVATGEVLDDSPTLQPCLAAVFRQHQTVGGLPHRCGDDVAQRDVALAFAENAEGKFAPFLRAVLRQALQRAIDLRLRLGIGELQRGDFLEHRLHEAAVCHQAQSVARERAAIAGQTNLERFDPKDAAPRRYLTADLDLTADECVEQCARRAKGLRTEW